MNPTVALGIVVAVALASYVILGIIFVKMTKNVVISAAKSVDESRSYSEIAKQHSVQAFKTADGLTNDGSLYASLDNRLADIQRRLSPSIQTENCIHCAGTGEQSKDVPAPLVANIMHELSRKEQAAAPVKRNSRC